MNLGFSGRFELTAHKVQPDQNGTPVLTGESRHLASFDNLILDAGLERMATGSAIQGCCVGTGNSTPVTTQTQLDTIVAVTDTFQGSQAGTAKTDTAPYWSSWCYTFRYATGVAAGNLSEVGIGWGPAPNAKTMAGLWSRALIRDTAGKPTTITVLADEILDVTYTVQLHVPSDDVTGTVKISGIDYNYTIRPALATTRNGVYNEGWDANYIGLNYTFNRVSSNVPVAYSGNIGDVKNLPTGNSSPNCTFANRSYIANSKQIVIDMNFALNEANFSGGIRSIAIHLAVCSFQIQFSRVSDGAAIPKDNTKTLKIPFVVSWGRANAAQ